VDVSVYFDLYKAEPVAGKTFADAFTEISAIPVASRKTEVQGRPYRMSHLAYDKKRKLWTGDIVRVRMQNLPGIADLESEDIRDIELDDNEGISECAAFLFSEPDNILFLQRSRMAVGSHLVSPLFRKLSGVDSAWSLDPVPRPDALQRILTAAEVKTITVKFARVKASALTLSPKDGDVKAIELIQTGIVPSFKLEMSNGRGGEKMNVRSAIALVKRLFSMSGKSGNDEIEIDHLRVQGTDADGEVLDVKMLDYQLSFKGLASDLKSRRIPYSSRRVLAERAYDSTIADARSILKD
jgi:hypothetical protein